MVYKLLFFNGCKTVQEGNIMTLKYRFLDDDEMKLRYISC